MKFLFFHLFMKTEAAQIKNKLSKFQSDTHQSSTFY